LVDCIRSSCLTSPRCRKSTLSTRGFPAPLCASLGPFLKTYTPFSPSSLVKTLNPISRLVGYRFFPRPILFTQTGSLPPIFPYLSSSGTLPPLYLFPHAVLFFSFLANLTQGSRRRPLKKLLPPFVPSLQAFIFEVRVSPGLPPVSLEICLPCPFVFTSTSHVIPSFFFRAFGRFRRLFIPSCFFFKVSPAMDIDPAARGPPRSFLPSLFLTSPLRTPVTAVFRRFSPFLPRFGARN